MFLLHASHSTNSVYFSCLPRWHLQAVTVEQLTSLSHSCLAPALRLQHNHFCLWLLNIWGKKRKKKRLGSDLERSLKNINSGCELLCGLCGWRERSLLSVDLGLMFFVHFLCSPFMLCSYVCPVFFVKACSELSAGLMLPWWFSEIILALLMPGNVILESWRGVIPPSLQPHPPHRKPQ